MKRQKTLFILAVAAAFILTFSLAALAADSGGDQTGRAEEISKAEGGVKGDVWEPESELWDDTGTAVEKGKASGHEYSADIPDPLEGWNRFWFGFNDKFYFWLFKPMAQGYKYVLPEKPRSWVNNFFHNLLFPVRFVSCVLQGKLLEAGTETSRFIANTAFGLGGLSDFAYDLEPHMPLRSSEEDLGQTFGSWGIGNGFYLVWPFIGPSTARDTVGLAGDSFLDPVSYVGPLVRLWGHQGLLQDQRDVLSHRRVRGPQGGLRGSLFGHARRLRPLPDEAGQRIDESHARGRGLRYAPAQGGFLAVEGLHQPPGRGGRTPALR